MSTSIRRTIESSFWLDEAALRDLDDLLGRVAQENEEALKRQAQREYAEQVAKVATSTTSIEDINKRIAQFDAAMQQSVASDTKRCCAVTYSFRCSDDSAMKAPSLDNILGFPNRKDRRITAISASVGSYGTNKVEISIGRSSHGGAVSVDVTGEDLWATAFVRELEALFRSWRPWYWPLYRNETALIAAIVVSSVVFMAGGLFYGFIALDESVEPKTHAPIWLGIWSTLSICLGALYAVAKARDFFFPRVIYATGEGLRRKDRIQKAHTIFFIGIFLSLLVGVAANFIYSRLVSADTQAKGIPPVSISRP